MNNGKSFEMMERQKQRDIRNILTVLSTAVICAGILASLFLYYYGPSGSYIAGHTLLDPAIIEQINFQDQHPQTGKKVHFAFDHIEFSYFDSQKGEIRLPSIPLETYQQFYSKVAFEKSLDQVTLAIQDLFLQSCPSLLTIKMRTMEGERMTTKVFQVVQFVQEDYFRVQLHQANAGEWAYFHRPGLYHEMIRLFTQGI
jgi:hypothetical protein